MVESPMHLAVVVAVRVLGLQEIDILDPVLNLPWHSTPENQIYVNPTLHIALGELDTPIMPSTSPVELKKG